MLLLKKKKKIIVGSGNMNSRRKNAIFIFSVGCECYESVLVIKQPSLPCISRPAGSLTNILL